MRNQCPGSRQEAKNISTTDRFGTCPACSRTIGIYIPKGGDGSLAVMRNHKGKPQ